MLVFNCIQNIQKRNMKNAFRDNECTLIYHIKDVLFAATEKVTYLDSLLKKRQTGFNRAPLHLHQTKSIKIEQ